MTMLCAVLISDRPEDKTCLAPKRQVPIGKCEWAKLRRVAETEEGFCTVQ